MLLKTHPMKKNTPFKLIAIFLLLNKVLISQCTPANVPYYESFSTITANNQLPACWAASNMSNTCLTYASPSLCAGFNASISNTSYFYSKPINLYTGITYSASVWYKTDNTLGTNWTNFGMMIGASQSSTGLSTIANLTGTVTSGTYVPLSNTFVVSTSGVYYLSVGATGNTLGTSPNLFWDDLSVIIPCNLTVNQPSLNVSANLTSTLCSGSVITLTAVGANSYTWSTGSNAAVVSFTPAFSNNYVVSGTKSLTSCSASTGISFTVIPSPIISFTNIFNPCMNSTVLLMPSILNNTGPLTYSWNTGATTNSIIVSPTVNTSYSVLVTNTTGCQGSAVANIIMAALPDLTVSATPSIICLGESAVLSFYGANSYSTGIVNGTTTSNTIAITPTTSSIYTITGFTGCVALKTVSVNVNPCTGLNEMGIHKTQAFKVILYPQPASEILNIDLIDFESNPNQNFYYNLEISNTIGQVLLSQKIEVSKTMTPVNVQNFDQGIYLLSIKNEKGQLVNMKFIIEK